MDINKEILLGVGLAIFSYFKLRHLILELIVYFEGKDLYKKRFNESSIKQKIFYTRFKDILPKHIYLINDIGLMWLCSMIAIAIEVHFSGAEQELFYSYFEYTIYFVLVLYVILEIVLKLDKNGNNATFDRIYEKRSSKKTKKK